MENKCPRRSFGDENVADFSLKTIYFYSEAAIQITLAPELEMRIFNPRGEVIPGEKLTPSRVLKAHSATKWGQYKWGEAGTSGTVGRGCH